MPTYKVVEKKKSSFFSGALTAPQLEDLINETARAGWTLDRIVAGETARFMGMGEKDVFLLIFKRDDGSAAEKAGASETPASPLDKLNQRFS